MLDFRYLGCQLHRKNERPFGWLTPRLAVMQPENPVFKGAFLVPLPQASHLRCARRKSILPLQNCKIRMLIARGGWNILRRVFELNRKQMTSPAICAPADRP